MTFHQSQYPYSLLNYALFFCYRLDVTSTSIRSNYCVSVLSYYSLIHVSLTFFSFSSRALFFSRSPCLHTPDYWFSAHLHCKFAALVPHPSSSQPPIPPPAPPPLPPPPSSSAPPTTQPTPAPSANASASAPPPPNISPYGGGVSTTTSTTRFTRFLALDKCLPRRGFLQLVTIPRPTCSEQESSEQVGNENGSSSSSGDSGGNGGNITGFRAVKLHYDCEWLAIMRKTHGNLRHICICISPTHLNDFPRR